MATTARISGIIPVPLNIFRESTVTLPIVTVNSDGITPYNLTGCSITFQAKWSILDTESAVELLSSNVNEILVTSAVDGEFSLIFGGSITSVLPVGVLELPYEVRITTGSSVPLLALFGTLRVLPNVVT